jgi:hypothetical protein
MPAFNLPKIDDFSQIEPVFTDPAAKDQGAKPPAGEGGTTPRPSRAQMNARVEKRLGPFGQLLNTLASPDVKTGVVVGPINAISKLGNAIGDAVQGKQIDTRDAWQIPEAVVRKYNPFRVGIGQEVTPADQAGYQVGGGIGAEILGAATGTTLIRRLGQVGQLKRIADAARRTQAVRNLAVAQRASQPLRTAMQVGTNVGEALVSTTLATPFLNVSQGNLANVGDAFGMKLPGRVDEGDNYLQAFGKSIAVEGLAAPLAAIGALSFIGPARRAMFGGEGIKWMDDLAEQELEPYTREWRDFKRPQLPPGSDIPQLPSAEMQAAAEGSPITPATINVDTPGGALPGTPPGLPQLPSYESRGGALVPGSAIERYFNETTQIRQVEQQRQRLVDAELIREGENNQWELNIGDGVNPEIESQIRGLQSQRGALLEQLTRQPDAAQEITKQLDEIDTQVADLTMSGSTEEFLAPRSSRQLDINLDTRPELDTFLAYLDELDDGDLRDIHSRVQRTAGAERSKQELAATQQEIERIQAEIADIEARRLAANQQKMQAFDETNLPTEELYKKYPGLEAWEARETVLQKELSQDPRYTHTYQRGSRTSGGPASIIGSLNQAGFKERERILKAELGNYPGPQIKKSKQRLTDRGAKSLLTKTQRSLQAAQMRLQAIQERMAAPETTVGHQLELSMGWQTGLDLSPGVELPQFSKLAVDPETAGYRTIDEYRASLEGVKRDTLRRIVMPESSPEVAALLKARTGRRVWGAKKSDIIDALVEMAQRRYQFLPRDVDQLELGLTRNLVGAGDAPLLDVPADLTTTSRMGQVVDADGNSMAAPMAEYQPRGMDAQTREQLKADILRRAIDNGEVQAPVTPIPNRPHGPQSFNQGTFLDDLLSDDTGQMAMQFVNDELPLYKAGGKNSDALLDEMRLRFEYNILDAKAMQAQKDALMAAHGWDRLSWDEKKRLGLMGRGMFAFSRDELPDALDQVRPATAAFTPELAATGERAPQPYRGEGTPAAQQVQQFNPELKPGAERKPQTYNTETVFASVNGEPVVGPRATVTQPNAAAADPAGTAPPRPKSKPAAKAKGKGATPLQKQAEEALNDIQAQRQEIQKQLDELRKKHQGGSC